MKSVIAVLLIGALAPMLQGVAGTFVAPRLVPDLSMLVVIGLGLHWRSAGGGAAFATVLGFVVDLLSGALLGHHALLRLFAFGSARVCSRQLNLRGPLPQMTFVAGFTVANALGSHLLTVFFASGPGLDPATAMAVLPHAGINALFAVPVVNFVGRLNSWLDDSSRQLLVLSPRNGAG